MMLLHNCIRRKKTSTRSPDVTKCGRLVFLYTGRGEQCFHRLSIRSIVFALPRRWFSKSFFTITQLFFQIHLINKTVCESLVVALCQIPCFHFPSYIAALQSHDKSLCAVSVLHFNFAILHYKISIS